MNGFNGINNNYFPEFSRPIAPRESDCFVVEQTDDGPVVLQKQRVSSVDLGSVSLYSLESLLKNGVDPASLKIHTGSVSRLDSSDDLSKFEASVDSVFNDESSESDLNSINK